jgi:hypothetical protein
MAAFDSIVNGRVPPRSIDEPSNFRLRYANAAMVEVTVSVVTEILSLRCEKSSSVANLIALMEHEGRASDPDHKASRHYAVLEAADTVLLNVAAHAADQLGEPTTIRKTRRALLPFRRKPRRIDPGHLHQRRLFA